MITKTTIGKAEKPQSWNSKGLVDLQKTLLLLRKIFLFVPELMRNGWQRHNIAKLLTHILDHGNHPRLRQVGFHLLLLWLNDQVVEYPECMQLFSNAIPLDVFVLDEIESFSTFSNASSSLSEEVEEEVKDTKLHGLQFVKKLTAQHDQQPSELHNQSGLARDERIKALGIELNQTPIGNEHPLYPNPNQPTFNDSIALIHVFISNLIRLAYVASGSPPPPDEYDYPPGDQFEADDAIATGVGIDAATASAKFLFKIFRTYYITKFVPLISKSLNVEGASNNNKSKFLIKRYFSISHPRISHWFPQLPSVHPPLTTTFPHRLLSRQQQQGTFTQRPALLLARHAHPQIHRPLLTRNT